MSGVTMKIARVIGSLVNTIKLEHLNGYKLLWVEPVDHGGAPTEPPVLAVDTVQAGVGDLVLLCQEGKSARQAMESAKAPVEAVILGVVDHLTLKGEVIPSATLAKGAT